MTKEPTSIDDLFTKTGKLNSAILRRDWFKTTQLYNSIMEKTESLRTDVFLERIHWVVNKLNERPKCRICGNDALFHSYSDKFGTYRRTCADRKCIAKDTCGHRHATMVERYGSLATEKHRQSARDRVGDLFVKGRDTLMAKYGVTNPSFIPELIDQRAAQTILTLSTQYSTVTSIENNPSRKTKNVTFTCTECGASETILHATYCWRTSNFEGRACSSCIGFSAGTSIKEQELIEFINGLGVDCIVRTKPQFLDGKELDVFIPEFNLAVEFDGLYWHSERNKPDANYHLSKTELCEQNGIQLIHVFENEWTTCKDIVCSRIKSLVKRNDRIYSRKCTVRTVPAREASDFLNSNHLQGWCNSSLRLGLYINDDLVALMTFGKSRFDKDAEWELLRFCNKLNTNVVGGASKLFKYFIRTYRPMSVISYADRRWSRGGLYETMGFAFVHNTAPNYWYIENGCKLSHRMKYQKHKLVNVLETFDPSRTEWENMQMNGYNRIWDCGNKKYIWRSPE